MAKFKERKQEVLTELKSAVPVTQPSENEVKQKEEPKNKPVTTTHRVVVDEIKQV